jgi:hypothetical protein
VTIVRIREINGAHSRERERKGEKRIEEIPVNQSAIH